MANYGRPLKGKSRRTAITIYAPVGLLDVIDDYVEEHDKITDGAYSRSDFFTEAAIAMLDKLGLDYGDEVVRLKRTESVPKNDAEKRSGENTENKAGEGKEK